MPGASPSSGSGSSRSAPAGCSSHYLAAPIDLTGIGVLYGSMRIASFLKIATWRSGACTNSSRGYVNPKRLSSAGSRPSGKTGSRALRQLMKTEAAADIMNGVADLG